MAYRDTLIVLLLSAAPVRMRNLAMIEIGTHLIRGRGPHLAVRGDETKNRQRLTHPLPRTCCPICELYLDGCGRVSGRPQAALASGSASRAAR